MPGFDRSGPLGQGPMTGRGLGLCSGYARPSGLRGPGLAWRHGWYGRGRGFGFGRGRGFGRGYGRGYYPAYPADYPAYEPEPDPREEEKMLKDYVSELEEELSAVKKRLQEIENKEKE